MSSGVPRPGSDRDAPEPTVSQHVHASGRARVRVAGRDQYIVNPGNVFSVIVPSVLIIASFLVYQTLVGRAPQASGSPSAGGHGKQQVQQAAPLEVTLAYDQNHVDNGAPSCTNWVVAQPISALRAPADVGELDETDAHQLGGIDEGVTDFKIDVQGTAPTAVELIDFRGVDIERIPIDKGTDIESSDGCGPAPEAGFDIGLGSDPPVIAPVAGLDNGAAKKIPFPFVVSSTDIQQFQIAAVYTIGAATATATCGCLISWRLALDWSYEGKTGTTVIDDNGKPFQTIFAPFTSGVFAARWWDNNGAWSKV
jgi:hypothetical protein